MRGDQKKGNVSETFGLLVQISNGLRAGRWLVFLFSLFLPPSVVHADNLPSQQNGGEATETRGEQASKLPPCPTSENERNQVSPYYFNLCAGVHLPKSALPPEADGKPAIPPRPDYIPKELPPCPTWTPKSLISPYYPCPGQYLGLPKDEASQILSPEVKQVLDGILRLYYEPDLLLNYRTTLNLVGATGRKNIWRQADDSNVDQQLKREYFDKLQGGIFDMPTWRGEYYCCRYFSSDSMGKQWKVNLSLIVAGTKSCINSRAVEGYMNLHLYPIVGFGSVHPEPPENWYRHGGDSSGGGYAKTEGTRWRKLSLGFARGCLTRIELIGHYLFEDEINDKLHD